MARYRIQASGVNPRDYFSPETLAQQFGLSTDDLLNYIEQNGDLPPEIKNSIPPNELASIQKNFLSKLPTQEQGYQKYIEQTGNESDLTDEELSGRLTAFQGLEQGRSGIPKLDRNEVAQTTRNALVNAGASESFSDEFSQKVAEEVLRTGKFPVFNQPSGSNDQNVNAYHAIVDALDRRFALGPYSSQKNFSEDKQRLEEAIGARKESANQDQAVEDFLSAEQRQSAADREDFLAGEEGRALEAFRESVPRTLAGLNARGLLFSGDVPDALSTTALNLEGELEATRAELEAADNQFYFDAAYKHAIRKSLGGVEDYRAALDAEHNRIMTERENRFKVSQGNLDRTLDTELKRSDYQRTLDANRSRLKAQSDANKKNQFSELAGTLGKTVGTVAGAAVGGPVGGYVGGEYGGTIGKGIVG